MRTTLRPRVLNVVLLTVTAVNLLALGACALVHAAMLAGGEPLPRLELYLFGMAGWTLLVFIPVVGGAPGASLSGPWPPGAVVANVVLIVNYALNGVFLARPVALRGSPAFLAARARDDWRLATSFALLWLFAISFASLRACLAVHRRALPRARLAAYAARRGQP